MKGFIEKSFCSQNLPMNDHFVEKNSGKKYLFFQIPPLKMKKCLKISKISQKSENERF